jgi:hypothetical protein
MPKSHRIRTQIGVDKSIKVSLDQDFDQINILSLKILQSEVYSRQCSDYGVIVGRVFVNGGFGLPNAKVSIFIPLQDEDSNNPVITELYPYESLSDVNEDGYRYNLLPKLPSYEGHSATGTFPTKDETLLEQTYIEVYDKYYKYTSRTNDSGDYMIFGIPLGTQTVFLDVDLSDMGCFSLTPQDLIQNGNATESQFDGNTFKTSSNLNELPQIKTLNKIVDISPLWGDTDVCQLGITRVDFDLTSEANISIEPKAVFMGSIISTTEDDALRVSCKPKNSTGNLCELISGPGQILSIRQTIKVDVNGLPILEEFKLPNGGKVIDGDGSYLVNLPMNLDYIYTNEFGEQAISNDPKVGIPSKARYRFKFKWENEGGLQNEFLRANYFVPNIKEHGWATSGYGTDPLKTGTVQLLTGTTQPGQGNTVVFGPLGDSGLVFKDSVNLSSYSVELGSSILGPWTSYYGDTQLISTQTPNDFVRITLVPQDPNQQSQIIYKFYNQQYFDLLKSYSFSLDWDDYADSQAAINCEDTFYELHYNKVYTTAMFLDRYKKGLGRAKHLGIKEIDNRTCKSTTNTFPVNDVIRNFDFLFFIFNLFISILTPLVFIPLLFIAHLISFIWPILKFLLVFLGIYLTYLGIDSFFDLYYYITELASFGFWAVLQVVKQFISATFYTAAGLVFIYVTLKYLIKIDNFPRLGLPMLSYPDCTTCDCECGPADFSEANNITESSVTQSITDAQSQVQGADLPPGTPEVVISDNSFIGPINLPTNYSQLSHPNITQPEPQNDPTVGYFYCLSCTPFPPNFCTYKSISYAIGQQWIESNIVSAASSGFQRLFSGSESLDSNSDYYGVPGKPFLHAPNHFLFSAQREYGINHRFFAKPFTETLSQKLNEFNLRQKYFDGVNQIKTTFNQPQNVTEHKDQVLVVLAKQGTLAQIGVGNLFTFQDGKLSLCNQNLTGASFHDGINFTQNQFNNNAVTGTCVTGTTNILVPYATNENSNVDVPYILNYTGETETYLKHNIDLEYFQIISGYTYSGFSSIADFTNTQDFPSKYLRHDSIFVFRPNCSALVDPPLTPYQYKSYSNVIESIAQSNNIEILIITRGVDPHTPKQNNSYDLSRIFGKAFGSGPIVTGDFYLNIPIKGVGVKPATHIVSQNDSPNDLYFKPYNFKISETYIVSGVTCNEFSGFTSTLPYYYLCPDESIATNYVPVINFGFTPINILSPSPTHTINGNAPERALLLPTITNGTYTPYVYTPYQSTINYYFAGGSFIASNSSASQVYQNMNQVVGDEDQYSNGLTKYAVYSPAYYRYSPQPIIFTVNQTLGQPQYLVMRSDRLPTSTNVQENDNQTSYALHQNTNFQYYTSGAQSSPSFGIAPDPSAGQAVYDETEYVQGLTSTLGCENMKPLKCYQGSGTNVSINPDCEIPDNRMVRGCYCLLNPNYLAEFPEDARLLLEWKTRFTLTFAACRGVFSQTFQNNWINGVLYMFTFNKSTQYSLAQPDEPIYKYCKDTIIYNELTKGFYYRSSPWDGNNFIGVESPAANPLWPASLRDGYPGLGYNIKRVQFPTTIMDLGPRDKFINQICGDSNLNGYLADQIKSTSYQDNSDLIQMGFISRLLSSSVWDQIFPVGNPSGGSSEGKGIVQFFNSNRKGDRVDGDFAQALSINSEWKVAPYLEENYPNNFLYIGNDATPDQRPVFGIFYSSSTEDYRYRRQLSPGIEIFSNKCGGVFNFYGYSSDQVVPHYRWSITGPTNSIFGTENNNWDTNVLPNGGFFNKHYQDLDFNTDPYFRKPINSENYGFITNFDSNNNPQITYTDVVNGQPNSSILVGAPHYFYFGLTNGNTAIDKFIKLYVNAE